jgi:hypothetical protein
MLFVYSVIRFQIFFGKNTRAGKQSVLRDSRQIWLDVDVIMISRMDYAYAHKIESRSGCER